MTTALRNQTWEATASTFVKSRNTDLKIREISITTSPRGFPKEARGKKKNQFRVIQLVATQSQFCFSILWRGPDMARVCLSTECDRPILKKLINTPTHPKLATLYVLLDVPDSFKFFHWKKVIRHGNVSTLRSWGQGGKKKAGRLFFFFFSSQPKSHFKHFSATTELSLAWKRKEAIVI